MIDFNKLKKFNTVLLVFLIALNIRVESVTILLLIKNVFNVATKLFKPLLIASIFLKKQSFKDRFFPKFYHKDDHVSKIYFRLNPVTELF